MCTEFQIFIPEYCNFEVNQPVYNQTENTRVESELALFELKISREYDISGLRH